MGLPDIPLSGFRDLSAPFCAMLLVDYDKAERHNWRVAVRDVSINNIVPTQDFVSVEGINYYSRYIRFRNPYGFLPNGVRFKGSNKVYLNDGHHRLYIARQRRRKTFRMIVYDVSIPHPDDAFVYE